jgi:ectoine hydroxylase-related dioxygenase (phytanoyl-CoA dioxygenase family)
MGELTAVECEALDREGFIVFPGAIDAKWLETLRSAFESVMRDSQPVTTGKQTGTRHAADLVSKDVVFQSVVTHSKLTAAAQHILGRPYRVSQLGGRDPLPGFGQQGLHADWYARTRQEPYSVVTSIWLLDDFTEQNGSTRVVPGSHLQPHLPSKSFKEPAAHHPDERIITAPAGSVLVFNGHLWHSGTRNNTNLARRALQCVLVAADRMQTGIVQTE